MVIRKFNRSDLSQVIRLISGLPPDDRLDKVFENFITTDNTIVLETDQEFQEIVGCSLYQGNGDHFQILWLFVKESERGNGFGRELLEFTEDEIKSRGGKLIELCPLNQEQKDELITHYKKWGYVRSGERILKVIEN
jgi:GNAT superfamily N-acetyltransferase